MKNRKLIMIYSLLIISLLSALTLSYFLDKALYLCPEEYIENNEISRIMNDIKTEESVEIKYNWQIAIPKINVIAPIGEGSDSVTLRNRVGHIIGTGKLSRKYLPSSGIIIQEIILLDIITLIELTN